MAHKRMATSFFIVISGGDPVLQGRGPLIRPKFTGVFQLLFTEKAAGAILSLKSRLGNTFNCTAYDGV